MKVLDDYECKGQMSIYDLLNQDSWSGKTSPEHSAATKAKTSEPSLKKRQGSQIKPPLFLDLRTASGHQAAASWQMGGALLGEYTTHSFGECPSEEKESLLSQILQGGAHPKYYLSAKACQGILNRAERRGKKLPEQLDQALRRQAQSVFKNENVSKPLSNAATDSDHVPIVCLEGNGSRPSHKGNGFAETMYTLNSTEQHAVYDARGNGDGNISPTITGDHENRITDYTAITYQTKEAANDMYVVQSNWDGQQIAPTLTSNNVGGNQRMPDKDNFNAVISFTTEITPKTDAEGTAFSSRSRDFKDPQAVAYGLDRASYNQGKNAKFGFSIEEERVGAQTAPGPFAVCQSIVRRLTPLECERLQGYPDNWTNIGEWVDSKGKKHKDADSPRYKALGNSIALTFWGWMAKRMVAYFDHEPTMASLFDGIGGFPLTFSRAGAIPIWASEIEEFPIAVTKIRFPET